MAISRLEGGAELETGGRGSASASLHRQGRRFALFSRCGAGGCPSVFAVAGAGAGVSVAVCFVLYSIMPNNSSAGMIGRKCALEDSVAFTRGGWCPSPAVAVLSRLSRCFPCSGLIPFPASAFFPLVLPSLPLSSFRKIRRLFPVLPPFFLPSFLPPLLPSIYSSSQKVYIKY